MTWAQQVKTGDLLREQSIVHEGRYRFMVESAL